MRSNGNIILKINAEISGNKGIKYLSSVIALAFKNKEYGI